MSDFGARIAVDSPTDGEPGRAHQPDRVANDDLVVATGREGVAIIGMACLFPGAPDLDTYWRNILGKVDAVSDPPPEAWDPNLYYDPQASGTDRVYCKRGGYLGSLVSFDPLAHGIPPIAVGGEPDQWLALQLARDAMADAGYTQLEEKVRRRTAVVLGKGTYLNGGNAIATAHGMILVQTLEILKSLHPEFTEADLELLREGLKSSLPPMGPETVPGLIPNIIVGRIANRLDLMGPTYTVDAACASSLIAVQLALRDLHTGECDLALVGGSQVWIPVPTLNVFCQLGALSRRQEIRPFDRDADGTLLGEGIGMVVLKRLADAERDGDRVYAVIRGVGVASDGRGVSVMAPRVEGEELALRRAYEAAGVSPRSVGLIEAHGTGTPVGDVVEVQALTRVFGERGDDLPWCALGSVKSMISHTMPAAGVAGLIKATLALYHKVLPPTLHCYEPNPKLELEKTPFYLNTETRPWIHAGSEPRRAGVNAFGFGGINAHVVLEEYRPRRSAPSSHLRHLAAAPTAEAAGVEVLHHLPPWESEACILAGESPAELLQQIERVTRWADARLAAVNGKGEGAREGAASLRDLAFTLHRERRSAGTSLCLGVVATSLADLRAKLAKAARRLADPACRQIKDVTGIYYAAEPLGRQGKLAFLFPGEGAQYPNMLADLCLHFPEVRAVFDLADRIFLSHPRKYLLSDYLFPRPAFSEGERAWAESHLAQMDGAIEAMLTANHAMLALLRRLGLTPDVIVGHSTGEFSAMAAAGILNLDSAEQLAHFNRELFRNYQEAEAQDNVPRAVLLAVGAEREQAEAIAREAGGQVYVAMDNCPHQVVLVGEPAATEQALAIVQREGLIYERLTLDRAYHTRMFAPYTNHLRQIFAEAPVQPARIPIYSCTTAAPYPTDPAAIRELVVDHWERPVEFRRTIEALYAEGVRLFVECGPRGNLSAFVEDILRGRPFCAIPANLQRRSGITQLNHAIALLAAHGVDLDLDVLYQRRGAQPVALEVRSQESAPAQRGSPVLLATTLPVMRLPPEVARRLRRESGVPAPADGSVTTPATTAADAGAAASSIRAREVPTPPPAPTSLMTLPGSLDPPSPPNPPAPDGLSAAISWQPVPAPAEEGAAARASAMQAYLQTMEEFLLTQEEVMRAYLGPGAGIPLAGPDGHPLALDPAPPAAEPPAAPASGDGTVVAVPTPPPDASPTFPAPAPAPLEVPSASEAATASLPAEGVALAPAPASAPARPENARAAIAERLLALVSERTGYPIEMLDPHLDLEADLGIDSIKRVEILGSYRQRYGALEEVDLEQLTTRRTLQQIIDILAPEGGSELPADATAPQDVSLSGGGPSPGAGSVAAAAYPLLGSVVSHTPEEELVAERLFDPAEDRYLRDHTLGQAVSTADPDLMALAVMPLTMSLEIVAEAAASLLPGRTVVGMRDIRAHRWLAWDGQPQILRVTARRPRSAHDRVMVQIRNLTEDQQSEEPPKSPVLEATVLLAESYPPAPAPRLLRLASLRPSRWRPDQLYREVMFHGPSWRGVAAIDQTGDDGTLATLRVLPFDRFLRGDPAPRFVLDPVVLDAAGQVIGFWTVEHLPRGQIIFPFHVEALELYGPPRPAGETVTCAAAIQLIGEQQVRSDIDMVAADGRLWMRLVGWEDKRFDLPPQFQSLLGGGEKAAISTPWPEPIASLPRPERLRCHRLETTLASDRGFWKRVWAMRVLERTEREQFRQLRTPEPRQIEWLAARTAAKEAIQHLLRARYGLEVALADITIRPDERGRPLVDGPWRETVPDLPVVSLAHRDGWAVALAGLREPGDGEEELHLGIDLEPLRRPVEFAAAAFTTDEQQLLESLPPDQRDEWALRCWCAKEAVGKALGYGLVDGPGSVAVVAVDPAREIVATSLAGQLAAAFPRLAITPLAVHTRREDEVVVATTLCEPYHAEPAAGTPARTRGVRTW